MPSTAKFRFTLHFGDYVGSFKFTILTGSYQCWKALVCEHTALPLSNAEKLMISLGVWISIKKLTLLDLTWSCGLKHFPDIEGIISFKCWALDFRDLGQIPEMVWGCYP